MRGLLVRYGLAMTSVVLVAFLVPLGLLARSLASERAVSAARQDAQQVSVFVDDPVLLAAALVAVNDEDRKTTVFAPSGHRFGAEAPRSQSVVLASTGRAFTARTTGGLEILLPVGGADGVNVVRTFVPDSELTDGVPQAWIVLGLVGFVLLAGTALAGDRVAARLSKSVRDLAEVAQRLSSGELDARVLPSGPPEVASVGLVLNGLGERVGDLLADEREMIADLSHRLRTPITALRLDADLLTDTADRVRIIGHVDDLVAAVDELIETARSHDRRGSHRCDAARVVADRSKFWAVLARAQRRSLTVDVPGDGALVAVDAAELGAALDVLVDNVFKHTPPGTALAFRVLADLKNVSIVVSDAGPGMPPGDLTQRRRSGAGQRGSDWTSPGVPLKGPGEFFLWRPGWFLTVRLWFSRCPGWLQRQDQKPKRPER